MCTSCEVGSYLEVLDFSTLSGKCNLKTTKPNSDDIVVYVSNLEEDIDREESLQDGSIATPYGTY